MANLDKSSTKQKSAEHDFIEWLKQDDLFDHYNANPDQQDSIFNDYQREKKTK